MNNMFENAKFGDKFRTRDGKMAIYWATPQETGLNRHALIVEGSANGNYITCDNDGYCLKNRAEHQCDIIGEWEESINEEELEKIANGYNVRIKGMYSCSYRDMTSIEKEMFKAGYREAKSEQIWAQVQKRLCVEIE